MSNLKQIDYVVGIEFGSTTSGVSIAHVQDPFNIITVLSWNDTEKVSKKNSQNYSSRKFLSSILYPSDEDDNLLCGVKSEDVDNEGVYIANIGHYLVDIETSNEKLGQLMNGLTIKKVVTDYLKYFVRLGFQKLLKHDNLVKNEYFQDFVNEGLIYEENIYEKINTIHYCLVCPTGRQEFMKDCFIEAGIIDETEAKYRLSFVTEVVATAHYQLSLDRNVSGIQNDQNYLVCNISDVSVGIAKIHAASTESLSTVTEVSDDFTQGSINLEIRFRDYLIKRMTELDLTISEIDHIVNVFTENIKYKFTMDAPEMPAFIEEYTNGVVIVFTYEDLNRIIFEPFIKSITDFISIVDKTHGQCQVFLSGRYGVDSYLAEELTRVDPGRSEYYYSFVEDSIDMISSGAVSSVLQCIYFTMNNFWLRFFKKK